MWDQFITELFYLDTMTLPRIFGIRLATDIQLVGFSDASQRGYAIPVCLRVVIASEQISVHFVTCKTKVAPLKISNIQQTLSIQRFELCAEFLLAQNMDRIKTVLASEISISDDVHGPTLGSYFRG